MMYCRHVSWYLTRLRKLPTKWPRCNGPVGRSPVKITGAAPQEVIAALMQNLSKIEKDEFWQMKTFYHSLCGSEARARGGDAVAVARDGRLSGPELAGALTRGIRAAGVDVFNLGQVPTP